MFVKISIKLIPSLTTILFVLIAAPITLHAHDRDAVGARIGVAMPFDNYGNTDRGAAKTGYITQFTYCGNLGSPVGYGFRYARFVNGTDIERQIDRISDEYPAIDIDATTGQWIANALVVGPTFTIGMNQFDLSAHTLVGYSVVRSPTILAEFTSGIETYAVSMKSADTLAWILSIGGEVKYNISERLSVVIGVGFWYSEAAFEEVTTEETTTDGEYREYTTDFNQVITVFSIPIGIEFSL